MQPNLFLVGFQKCGSSTLFDLLLQHPDIVGSNPKETFALVDQGKANFEEERNIINPGFDWDVFFAPQKAEFYLEASVCNFYQKSALEYIAGLPEKKVIFILRDPIERFCSSYDYYGPRITTQPVTSLSNYFELISSQPEKIDVEGAKFAVEHGKYLNHINLWEKTLGKNNVHLIGMKRMLKDPDLCLDEITRFLNIKPMSEPIALGHKNQTKHIKNKRLDFYVQRFFGGTGLSKSFLGNVYQKMNKTTAKPIVEKDVYEKLTEIYAAEYDHLKMYF